MPSIALAAVAIALSALAAPVRADSAGAQFISFLDQA